MDFLQRLDDLSDDGIDSTSFHSMVPPVPQVVRGYKPPRLSVSQKNPPCLNATNNVWTVSNHPNSSHSSEGTSFSAQHTNDTSSSNIHYHNENLKSPLIPTSVLTDKAQSLFKFSSFNNMQSKSFYTMYEQDHNCVISSPTGSGKTVLFELAILRLLNTNSNSSNIKILYIAPTKALCVEREKDWLNKFSTFGLSVGTLTSDTGFTESEKVKRCNIIITTPEKWDLMTRKWSDYTKLFEMIRLLLIDEIHILREDRGSTLEVVVTRMKKMCQSMRIVALSATVPNIQDVASWLKLDSRNPHNAITLVFGDEYRPVKLEKVIYSYKQKSNDFVFDTFLNSQLIEVLNEHCKGKPALIFCPTRNSTVSTAKYISKHFQGHLSLNGKVFPVKERDLAELSQKGIAFHHAGLSMEDRNAIEKSFISGSIRILCCTSTLAVGVNLPAYLVIIKGTRIWNSVKFEEYSELDILQMMGRAGRPQFETQGKAVLMTTQDMQRHYEQLVKGNEKLESRLHLNLHENIVSEVHLKTITSLEDTLEWMQHTFFYSRYRANPTAYGEIPHHEGMDMNGRLMKYCEGKLKELADFMLIKLVDGSYQSTPYGDSMTRHYVFFETMKTFIKSPLGQSVSEILSLISKSFEFKNIRLKRTEKRLFRELNDSPILKYRFKSSDKKPVKIENSYEKISLLVQYELGGLEYPNDQDLIKLQQSFKQDKLYVFKHITRLIRCLVDVFVEKKDFVSLKNCLFLSSCLNGGCWENSPMVLKQLEGVTLSHVRRLANHNIKSFVEIAAQEPNKIEYNLGLRPGAGLKIKNQIQSLPRFALNTEVIKVSRPRDGSGLRMSVECFLDVVSEAKKWKGRTISIVVTSGLSSGELIDFRRSFISKITGSSSFTIQVPVQFTNSNLETCIYCEEIAGLGTSFVLDLTTNLSSTHSSALSQPQRNPQEDEFETEDDLDSLLVKVSSSKTAGIKRLSSESDLVSNTSRKILDNNGLQCKHTCKDKTKCRHLCCREGIAPSTAKRIKVSSSRADSVPPDDSASKSLKETSGYDLLKKLHEKSFVSKQPQLSKFRTPAEAKSFVSFVHSDKGAAPQKSPDDKYDHEGEEEEDDNFSDDLDILSMLRRPPRSTQHNVPALQRPQSEGSLEESADSIMELRNYTGSLAKQMLPAPINHDTEDKNNIYERENEYGEGIQHLSGDDPTFEPHGESISFQGNLSNCYHDMFHKDQTMDEILDNTLENEFEGLFGSDVDVV